MPRINVEDKFFQDRRLWNLSLDIVEQGMASHSLARDLAVGMSVAIWREAQRFWFPKRLPIPKEIFFELSGAKLWVKNRLAKVVKGGVYVCGSDEQFSWLFQKSDAGKLGAKRRWDKDDNSVTNSKLDDNSVMNDDSSKTSKTALKSLDKKMAAPCSAMAVNGVRWPLTPTHAHAQNQKNASTASAQNLIRHESAADAFNRLWEKGVPSKELVEAWNLVVPRKVRAITPKRADAIRKGWSEQPDFSYWQEIFRKVSISAFLNDSERKNLLIELEWVFENHVKISEGKYDDAISNERRSAPLR